MNANETATLGGGCFWCLEAVFDELVGVQKVVSGYAGGLTPDPAYEEVCSGLTGHAEVVQITFDPKILSYRDLLMVFFGIHDPTTLNRQGADAGTQYRSVIFYHSPEQQAVAEQVIQTLTQEKVWKNPIMTQLVPAVHFYPAESYHQKYFQRNPAQPYCQVVIDPKLAKFRKSYAKKIRTQGPKVCASCGEPFPCNPGNCWCDTVTVSEQRRKKIEAQFEDCLCQKCLMKS
jgi:peptide-methionine (S)-S-oxide reductase